MSTEGELDEKIAKLLSQVEEIPESIKIKKRTSI